jgi:hypothetical protein
MSKKLDKFIGKTYIHPDKGKVEVIDKVPKSRTKLEVKIVDRGIGWDEMKKRYLGVRKPSGWMRGQNYSYGQVVNVHYADLEEVDDM